MKAKVSRELRQILADPAARSKLIGLVLEARPVSGEVKIRAESGTGRKSYRVKILGLRPSKEAA